MDEEDDDLYGPSEPSTETQKEPKKEKEESVSSGDEPMDEGADSGDDDDDSDSVGFLTLNMGTSRLTRLQDLEFIIDKPATAAKPAPYVYHSVLPATALIIKAPLNCRKTKQSRSRLQQPSPRPHHNRPPANKHKHGRPPGPRPRSLRYQAWATQPSTHPP